MLGTSLVQYALMWYVTLETRSGTMMTLFIICGFLPTLVLSPFAGVWADRPTLRSAGIGSRTCSRMTCDSRKLKQRGSSSRRRPCGGTRKDEDVLKKVKVVRKLKFQYLHKLKSQHPSEEIQLARELAEALPT